jgi:hypothetical protein
MGKMIRDAVRRGAQRGLMAGSSFSADPENRKLFKILFWLVVGLVVIAILRGCST